MLSNLGSQAVSNNLDDNPCSNFDFNWGSAIGSAIGGGWAASITRGAGPISGAVIGWAPSTASSTVGTALDE